MFKTSAILLTLCVCVFAKNTQFKVIMEWKYLNFTWPSAEMALSAAKTGAYVPENVIMAGIKYHEDFFYVALPRMKEGVPVTLARFPANGSTHAILSPFPSWTMNKKDDCHALQNTQNIEIDTKGQIWILDGGRTATLTKKVTHNCPAKLIVYDIKNEEVVVEHTFPEEIASRNSSFLYDIVVDESNGSYAYITDNSGRDPGIIVYSLRDNRSWKIRHSKSMKASSDALEFRVNGVGISATINIAGIALQPAMQSDNQSLTINEDRLVYYCPISSYHLYSISTSVLQHETAATSTKEFDGVINDVGRKASQTDGMIMDNEGTLYYGLLGASSISKWNTSTPFSSGQKVISRDEKFISWSNSFTFDDHGNLIVLTNNLQRFIYDKMDLNDINFRLLSAQTGTKSYLYSSNNNTKYTTVDDSNDDDDDDDDNDDNNNTTMTIENDSSSLSASSELTSKLEKPENSTDSELEAHSETNREPITEITPKTIGNETDAETTAELNSSNSTLDLLKPNPNATQTELNSTTELNSNTTGELESNSTSELNLPSSPELSLNSSAELNMNSTTDPNFTTELNSSTTSEFSSNSSSESATTDSTSTSTDSSSDTIPRAKPDLLPGGHPRTSLSSDAGYSKLHFGIVFLSVSILLFR